jgi:hypothetical protein
LGLEEGCLDLRERTRDGATRGGERLGFLLRLLCGLLLGRLQLVLQIFFPARHVSS